MVAARRPPKNGSMARTRSGDASAPLLKIIRGGTSCYTVAMCAQAGHEDAMLSFRDATVEKILKLGEWIHKLKGTVKPRLAAAKTGASN